MGFWVSSLVRKGTALAALGLVVAPLLPACADREVWSIATALDGAGKIPRDEFWTDTTTIYCVFDYSSYRKDIVVNGVIRQIKDDKNQNVDIMLGIGELYPGISHGKGSFQLSHPQPPPGSTATGTLPFPAGIYRCEIYVDGIDPSGGNNKPGAKPGGWQQAVEFKVSYPACPLVPPMQGVICSGYYKVNSACRGVDSRQMCVCDGNIWNCTP